MKEIERKFLVLQLPENLASFPQQEIEQSYLALDPNGVQVRLRRSNQDFCLTVKDHSRPRNEINIELTAEAFCELWPLTQGRWLRKTRYNIEDGQHTIEIDVYTGNHDGLIVAEIEFESEEAAQAYSPPPWIGREITDERRFGNATLARANVALQG